MKNFPFGISHRFRSLVLIAAAAWILAPAAPAQSGPGAPPPPMAGRWRGRRPGPGMGRHGFAKVVTGAPYTAQAVTTMVETLADGSHINRTVTASIARDSEGRTMRSQAFNGFGAASGQQNGATMVTIFDPVANQRIEYNTATKKAHIFNLPQRPAQPEGPGSQANSVRAPRGNRMLSSKMSVQTESLGTQTIDGVQAQGTKTTRTIAAGAIGNDKPLQSTDEEWYSPDLQMIVQSTRNDPRFGQTTYRLSDIQRAEPDASLFQTPQGFQITTGGGRSQHAGR